TGSSNSTALGVGTVTLGDSTGSANATLILSSTSATYSSAVFVASGSSGTLTIQSATANTTLTGAVTLAHDLNLGFDHSLTLSGGIGGTGNVSVLCSAGTITVSGNPLTFTGNLVNNETGT